MNLVDFGNQALNNPATKRSVIDALKSLTAKMKGRACFEETLPLGLSSSFLIYCLNDYFNQHRDEPLKTYLEIGSLFGGSLCALFDSGFSGTAYGVDIFSGYYGDFDSQHTPFPAGYEKSTKGHMQVVRDNASLFGGKPSLIAGNTQDSEFLTSLTSLPIQPLDVLFIDGDHTYKGAIADYYAFVPFLKNNGLVLFDNYEAQGVKDAVVEALREHANSLSTVGVWNDSTWVGIKHQ